MMASSEGGMDIEEVAHDTPEKIVKVFVDPLDGLSDAQGAELADGHRRSEGASQAQAIDVFKKLYACYMETDASLAEINPLILEGNGGDDQGARREVQLRRQRAVPPPRDRRLPRSRRGGPGRDRGQQVRPRLHPARRQHRLPGQRRRPGDGDDGHHQALRRRAGQLPRRRRRRHRREGHRGLQDHARQPEGEGDPRQHLRRHHALRHHRRRRDRRVQGGQPRTCRWSCA